jgi:regulator of protease activity HflC (stomatin/prohibitin superfamily)
MKNKVIVRQGFKGMLYENGAFIRHLDPGSYRLKQHPFDRTQREILRVDTRERSIVIKGQEILTADKVAIRVSLLVYFRIVDPESALHNVDSYDDRIYEDVQLSARRFLASRDLEAILSDRNEISDAVRETVRESAAGYGVEILRADVKDLIFPGNLREIMNRVLETERRAEAELIQARKDAEAAQVRTESEIRTQREHARAAHDRARLTAESELQQAQMRLQASLEEAQALQDNPSLLRLRELQALEKMAASGAKFSLGLERDTLANFLSEAGNRDED